MSGLSQGLVLARFWRETGLSSGDVGSVEEVLPLFRVLPRLWHGVELPLLVDGGVLLPVPVPTPSLTEHVGGEGDSRTAQDWLEYCPEGSFADGAGAGPLAGLPLAPGHLLGVVVHLGGRVDGE